MSKRSTPSPTTRRAFLAASTGLAVVAGCLSVEVPDGADGTPNGGTTPNETNAGAGTTTPTGTSTPTPTPTAESRSTSTPSVELLSFDSTGVHEANTILFTGTIGNPAPEPRTVLFVGEVDVEDGDSYTGRRLVSVPADVEIATRVKVRHSASGYFYYDHDAELVSNPEVSPDELRLPDDAHDLVVVDSDAEAHDDRIAVTAVVDNVASGARSATLRAVVRITGGERYTQSRDITVPGDSSETFELVIEPDEGGYTYRYWALVG